MRARDRQGEAHRSRDAVLALEALGRDTLPRVEHDDRTQVLLRPVQRLAIVVLAALHGVILLGLLVLFVVLLLALVSGRRVLGLLSGRRVLGLVLEPQALFIVLLVDSRVLLGWLRCCCRDACAGCRSHRLALLRCVGSRSRFHKRCEV